MRTTTAQQMVGAAPAATSGEFGAGMPTVVAAALEQHTDEVWMVRFSPSGQLLASASRDKTAVIWDVAQRKPRHVLRGHADGASWSRLQRQSDNGFAAVECVAWAPDEALLLTGGADGDATARLWDVLTGACIRVIDRHVQVRRSGRALRCEPCRASRRALGVRTASRSSRAAQTS